MMIERGQSKEAILQSGNIKCLSASDVPTDLLEKLKSLDITLDVINSNRETYAIGKQVYSVFKTGSASVCVTIPKCWVTENNVKKISWKIDAKTGYLIGIPTEV